MSTPPVDSERVAPASVYERIRSMILSHALPPGEKLTIDQLARTLGVSQTPVREALQRLEGDQLVVARKPRGYATTELLDRSQLRHMFEVRLLIEPWSARVVATDRAGNPGRAMLAEIDRFVEQSTQDGDRQGMSGHDTRFHTLLFDAVGNPFLADAFRRLHSHLHLFRLYPADVDGSHTVEEHRRIAQAIASADPDGAEEAMRAHLQHAMQRFAAVFDLPPEDLSEVRAGDVRPT